MGLEQKKLHPFASRFSGRATCVSRQGYLLPIISEEPLGSCCLTLRETVPLQAVLGHLQESDSLSIQIHIFAPGPVPVSGDAPTDPLMGRSDPLSPPSTPPKRVSVALFTQFRHLGDHILELPPRFRHPRHRILETTKITAFKIQITSRTARLATKLPTYPPTYKPHYLAT